MTDIPEVPEVRDRLATIIDETRRAHEVSSVIGAGPGTLVCSCGWRTEIDGSWFDSVQDDLHVDAAVLDALVGEGVFFRDQLEQVGHCYQHETGALSREWHRPDHECPIHCVVVYRWKEET